MNKGQNTVPAELIYMLRIFFYRPETILYFFFTNTFRKIEIK